MSEKRYYWLKLPKDFFKRNDVRIIEALPEGKSYLLFYISILLMATESNGVLRNNPRTLAFKTGTILSIAEEALNHLRTYGLLQDVDEDYFKLTYITKDTVLSSAEMTGRDRSTPEYKKWRSDVFIRDDYTCQDCGQKGKRLHAHHIKPWYLYQDLRFVASNGITLCESCHRKRHSRR